MTEALKAVIAEAWQNSTYIRLSALCDVENVGQMDASGVNLNINISTSTGGVLHNQDMDYGTVPAGAPHNVS